MPDKQSDRSALWDARKEAYRTSGLTLKEWCASNEVSYSAFCYHMRKQNKETVTEDIVFAPLTQESPDTQSFMSPVTIRFASATISISNHCHPDLLHHLLGAINQYAGI